MIKKYISPALLTIFFVLSLLFMLIFLAPYNRGHNEPVMVKISKGDSYRWAAALLEKEGVIFNEYIFILAGKIFNYDNKLIPGEYVFHNNLTIWQVMNYVTDPYRPVELTITIPEGYNLRQVGRILSRKYNLDSARFVNEAVNDSLIKLLGVDVKSLEGFLYPDTYKFNAESANIEKRLIYIMFESFMQKLTPEVKDSIRLANRNLKDVVIMASIIQGETRHVPEMRTIAGVYYNRLNKKMKLDADPTVQYSLPETKRRLTYSDLKFPSPYNTYINKGLPPGPISNPTFNAIMAAINPEKHNYLYFVAKGDGTHTFAETFEQHKKNVAAFRKFMEDKN